MLTCSLLLSVVVDDYCLSFVVCLCCFFQSQTTLEKIKQIAEENNVSLFKAYVVLLFTVMLEFDQEHNIKSIIILHSTVVNNVLRRMILRQGIFFLYS